MEGKHTLAHDHSRKRRAARDGERAEFECHEPSLKIRGIAESSSLRRITAIHAQAGPGNEACGRRSKEQYGRNHFLDRADPAQRNALEHASPEFLISEKRAGER